MKLKGLVILVVVAKVTMRMSGNWVQVVGYLVIVLVFRKL